MLLVAGVETLMVAVLVVDEDVVDQDHSAATTPTPTSTPTRAAARVPTQNLVARSARKLDMKRHHAGTTMMMMMISNKRLQVQPQQAMVSTQIGTWTVEPRTMSLGNWRR